MARRVLTILSLFALTGVLAIWFTSYYTDLTYRYQSAPTRAFVLTSRHGRVLLAGQYLSILSGPQPDPLSISNNPPFRVSVVDAHHYSIIDLPYDRPDFAFLGIAAGRQSVLDTGNGLRATAEFLRVPHYVLASLCCLPLLSAALISLRTRRRRARGLCPACAYDLRATPNQCPECGAIASAA